MRNRLLQGRAFRQYVRQSIDPAGHMPTIIPMGDDFKAISEDGRFRLCARHRPRRDNRGEKRGLTPVLAADGHALRAPFTAGSESLFMLLFMPPFCLSATASLRASLAAVATFCSLCSLRFHE